MMLEQPTKDTQTPPLLVSDKNDVDKHRINITDVQ